MGVGVGVGVGVGELLWQWVLGGWVDGCGARTYAHTHTHTYTHTHARAQVKIIDFGAAADMCTGVNFNPLYGMLDPRYCPPEELVMPKSMFL
jgi:hypothetical protein